MKKKKLTERLEKSAALILSQAILIDQQKNIIKGLEAQVLDLKDPMLNVGPNGELLAAKPVTDPEARYDRLRTSQYDQPLPGGESPQKRARKRAIVDPEKAYKEFAAKAVKDAAN